VPRDALHILQSAETARHDTFGHAACTETGCKATGVRYYADAQNSNI
jgi:hypothetical protein